MKKLFIIYCIFVINYKCWQQIIVLQSLRMMCRNEWSARECFHGWKTNATIHIACTIRKRILKYRVCDLYCQKTIKLLRQRAFASVTLLLSRTLSVTLRSITNFTNNKDTNAITTEDTQDRKWIKVCTVRMWFTRSSRLTQQLALRAVHATVDGTRRGLYCVIGIATAIE